MRCYTKVPVRRACRAGRLAGKKIHIFDLVYMKFLLSSEMMLKAAALYTLLALTSALTCPDASMCPDASTCCQSPSNKYGCCSLPRAVCCEDHLHCCYEGTVCDAESGRCLNRTSSLPWLDRVPAEQPKLPQTVRSFSMIHAVAVNGDFVNVCPDETRCPREFSCLKTRDGEYSCCPLPQGVSCFDGSHCCPSEYQCSQDGASCSRTVAVERVEAVICPDGASECPDDTTCCQLLDGSWGCCPMVKAVCCSDHLHCCPEGTTCDLKHSMCVTASQQRLPMWDKFPARRRAVWEDQRDSANMTTVTCPDGMSKCPDRSTCCGMPGGLYGCCPYPDALCCSDNLHCCPGGTTCDLERKTCSREERPLEEERPPGPPSYAECPDMLTVCPDESTCCQLSNGSNGCCPMPRAVCCEDHIHYCPEGTECDLVLGMCVTASGNRTWANRIPAVQAPPVRSAGRDVPCNESVACPDGYTCCKTAGEEWACCPLPEAVCCEDHLHCCPEGTICNLAASTCDDPSGSTLWLEKVPTFSWAQGQTANDKCDPTTSCPGEATCCKDATGKWACCPLPKAVCCEDHIHCCPQNTVCNVAASTCDDPMGSVPWVEKVPAVSEMSVREASTKPSAEAEDVTCDPTHACPSGNTCCKTDEGEWACCPLPQAVCCEDHLHCCPKDTVCNLAAGTCDNPSGSTSWLEKVPALPRSPTNERCDEQMVCPSSTTCCMQNSGEWACCPLPHAVCCEDHEHCCPKGYKCDISQQTCVRPGELSLPWVSKQPALPVGSPPPDTRQCDPQSSCPRDTTCCYMEKKGKWGCCPLPNAVCCDDGDHCCPAGYRCEVAGASCRKGSLVIPWYRKEQASDVPASSADVKCDAQKSCAAGTTCCPLPSGEWGCCPLVKAVCCSDHEHCCPQGYTCNMESGTCERKSGRMFQSAPLFQVFSVEPETTVASVLKTTPPASLETTPEPALEPTPEPAPETTPEGDELHCDEHYRCPKTETCCRTSATTWACCPSPKAVCCSDMKHCCPAGYSCNAADGSCAKRKNFTWDFFFGARKRSFTHV